VSKLVSFLSDPSEGICWVCNLSERHFSIYGEHRGEGAILLVQDANATPSGSIDLTADEKRQSNEHLSKVATG